MRIICWNDFSLTAREAASVAGLLAKRVGDTVTLMQPDQVRTERSTTRGERNDGGSSAPAERAAAESATAVEVAEVERTLAGTLNEFIKTAASPDCTRLIVVPDEGPVYGWHRARAAEQIAFNAPVPTLVLRDPQPLLAWARGERPLRILCANDLTKTADDALAFVKQLCGIGPCEVVVAHVHESQEEAAGASRLDDFEFRQTLERDLREHVRRILGDTPAEIRLSMAPRRRDSVLLDLATQEGAGLIVTGTRQRSVLERLSHPHSIARALLREVKNNVLLVPPVLETAVRPRCGIHRVLVATDLSWLGNQAVPYGYSLLPHGGTLRLLHVVHPRALPHGEFDQGVDPDACRTLHREVVEDVRNQLRELVLGEADAPGVATEIEIAEDRDPAAAIAETAARFGADIVCMAVRESNRILGRVFKSQIQSVMARSQRPLLLVHPSLP